MPRGRYARHFRASFVALLTAISGLVMTGQASALTLYLEAPGGPPVTVVDNGPGDVNPLIGWIRYNGPVGDFDINLASGFSKPILGDPLHAETDLQVVSVKDTGTGIGTLIIKLTDTDFPGTLGGTATIVSQVGGFVQGGSGSAVVQAFVDTANAAFGTTGPTVCTSGPQTITGTSSDTATAPCVLHGPFSITLSDQATLGAGREVSFDHFVGVEVPVCGTIGDFVWHDLNRDGLQDVGEPGINSVKLLLKDASSAVLATTMSGAHPIGGAPGYYQFSGVCKGDYTVEVDAGTLPPGFTATLKDVGVDDTIDNDSDGGPAIAILPADGASNQTVDFGFVSPCTGTIGDFVWNDLNQDGIQDVGEPGIDGLTVNMTGPGGASSTTTGPNGFYQFGGLCAGTYTVTVATPPGMSASPSFMGGDVTLDSNGSPTSTTLVGDSGSDQTLDFGFFTPCTGAIGDFVWKDLNRDGIQDAGEPGIQGVKVTLKNGTGTVTLATTFTDLNGLYEFPGICGGDYQVVVDEAPLAPLTPSPSLTTTPDKDSNGSPAAVTLPPNFVDHTIDFGYMPACSGSIGDFVWSDLNANGLQNAGEPGIPGVSLELRRPDNSLIAVTTTDASGLYAFTGLCKGDYKVVVVTPPAGYSASPSLVGGDATIDSNGSPALVTLPTDFTNDITIDFGYYQPAAIGDFVWHDVNANGIQDAAEPGIPDVSVTLSTCAGMPVGATMTDASGLYLFSNLAPGCYKVSFGAPASYTPSPANVGSDDAVDSDSVGGTTGNYTLAAGETNLTVDAGFYKPASLGDFVWNDKNANGVQDAGEPGIPGVAVTLYPCSSSVSVASTTTDGSGLYLFSDLAPGCYYVKFGTPAGFVASPPNVGSDATDSDSVGGVTGNYTLNSGDTDLTVDAGFYQLASLGDFVWKDLNANGTQDAGEPGIPGVSATLLKCDGTPTGLTTTTNASGLYLFSGLAPGCYKVQFGTPAGFTPSPANVGSDATDSDAVGGVTGNYTLAAGETNLTVDAGFYQLASLGDFVWKDLNANGTQDAGEPGISGVLVTLLKCDGTPTGSTTTTNASGLYLFSGLTPGCYKVQFATPAGLTPSPANVGSDATDSDAVGGVTGNYTLASGETNLTVDAGFFLTQPPVCIPASFNFSGGSSAVTGAAGNIRTFTNNGVNVHASAFSETKPGGTFATAYLGHYSHGLGVTDGSEDGLNNTHVVDNYGRNNYVLLEFSQQVVIDKAYLDYIVGDSDITVWIGNVPNAYTTHQNLNAAFLSSLAFTEVNNGGSTARWADLNAGGLFGNVLVIAAKTTETTDGFKLSQVVAACPNPVCVSGGTFGLTGASASYGTAGNIRTFTAGGVSVRASAFSRVDGTSGAWAKAFLGAYSGGLGVTDTSEGDGSSNRHKVDNIGGRNNYVLFEFSQPVVIDKAYLDIVGDDSDISVWIGSKANPYVNHLTLSDALLSGFLKEDNATPDVTPGSRWADFNSGQVSGNVLVISALVGDTTPEDAFKISKLAMGCPVGLTTYTQGGWGAPPSGNNPGMILKNNFASVYPSGYVTIGGTYTAKFTSQAAIQAFLPAGGSPGVFTASATNPVSSPAGVFGGQVLALRLNVDFSAAGITRTGLGAKKVVSGPLANYTVTQVLALANSVIGGNLGALPAGVTVSTLSGIVDAINNNYDNGTSDDGFLF